MFSLRSITFLAYVVVAFAVYYVPIFNWPFSWWMGFFHEISKALGILATGGSVSSLELSLRGMGTSFAQGGNIWFIATCSYCGAVLWGMLIYILADKLHKKYAIFEAIVLSLFILFISILWVRDILTILILIIMVGLLLSIIKLHNYSLMKITLKFIGIYIVLDGIRTPLNLLDGRIPLDLIPLMQQSTVFTYLSVFLWFCFALLGIYALWIWHKPTYTKKQVTQDLLKYIE
ncbi:M50 family metallopeptidase [Candidatus Berkiella cookevillensis]|uniref:M50 family metallopeptidase n=1 Tax=Candidatus Berkiella cookevillensis TaxID=437022 RepID=A0A0Q9YPQ6_9GAMM|nr:M50 family metallopeptidase [Candidatus Berkiella cookevillensis]MCS5707663.1 M50 family metallopeptidase [Candidatus Berkiella cookevillensis]